jgi:hypothetical protein
MRAFTEMASSAKTRLAVIEQTIARQEMLVTSLRMRNHEPKALQQCIAMTWHVLTQLRRELAWWAEQQISN